MLHSSILELGGPTKFLALGVVVNQVHFTIHLLRHTTLSSFYIICLTITPLTCTSCRRRASCFPVVSPTSSTSPGTWTLGLPWLGSPPSRSASLLSLLVSFAWRTQPWHCWTTFHQVDLQLILSHLNQSWLILVSIL